MISVLSILTFKPDFGQSFNDDIVVMVMRVWTVKCVMGENLCSFEYDRLLLEEMVCFRPAYWKWFLTYKNIHLLQNSTLNISKTNYHILLLFIFCYNIQLYFISYDSCIIKYKTWFSGPHILVGQTGSGSTLTIRSGESRVLTVLMNRNELI